MTMSTLKKYYIFIFAFFIFFVAYIPNIYEWSLKSILPSNRTFNWDEHIYTYDYNIYLSKIRQGQEGHNLIVDKYDGNPNQKGVFLQMLYLLTGKLTRPFGISPESAFFILRSIVSFLWILVIVNICIYYLEKPVAYSLGVVLSFLAASFPVFFFYNNEWWVTYFMNWWTEMDSLKRIAYIPHYTLNYIFVSIFSILIYKNQIALLCLLLAVSIFIHPAGAILLFFSWALYQSIHVVLFKRFKNVNYKKIILNTVCIFLSIIIPLLYIKYVTTSYPWKTLTDYDINHRLGVDVREYVLSLGPVFFTGMAGVILVIIQKKTKLLSLVTWVLGAFLAIYVFRFFPLQSELRFVQTANHIPLAILSAYFLTFVFKKYHHILVRSLIIIFIIAFMILGSVQIFFSIKSQNDFNHQKAAAVLPLVPYPPQMMYPLTDFYNGLQWLKNNTKKTDVVLSEITAGNYIPAYSGNFVFIGHESETPFFDEKSPQADMFFSGEMEKDKAFSFLKSKNISYVFFGPQEQEKNKKNINYDFLKTVYKSNFVIIFEVTK